MSATTIPLIDCQQVTKEFVSSAGDRFSAVNEVSFSLHRGEIVGLLGPDGAGKTTLIRLLTGLMKPNTGAISLLGKSTVSDARWIQSVIGYMPQKFGLYGDLTVQENMELYARLHELEGQARVDRFKQLLEMTNLTKAISRRADKLSGGMKQKLGLCCTLVSDPEVILLDEPTVGVDPLSRRELWNILQTCAREKGMGVLVSTSYMDESAYCDRTLVMYEGRLLMDAPPSEVVSLAQDMCEILQTPSSLNSRQFQSKLASIPGIINATPQGNQVRIVIPPSHPSRSELDAYHPQVAAPDFSDGFMTLLSRYMDISLKDESLKNKGTSAIVFNRDEVVIEVNDLVRRFGNFVAVDHVSFSVKRGHVFGLLGPNGAGKSTTFRMLCGLLPASSGSLSVAGENLRTMAAKARRKIGYVSQNFAMYGMLTAAQNLDFFAGAYGMSGAKLRSARNLMEYEFSLTPYMNTPAAHLPGGYKQRLSMACSLLHQPEILFLDEPTSGADPLARRDFWLRINDLADRGVTVIITTHFLGEAEFCDSMLIMMDGKMLAEGSPEDIRQYAPKQANGQPSSLEDAFLAITKTYREGGSHD